MPGASNTCVMLLSDKSSGSTALQRELAKHPEVRLVETTRHNEHETLYWNKAAALLGRPQADILNSELPMKGNRARQELLEFLRANLDTFQPPYNDRMLVFEGWQSLCRNFGPVFLEKSPHHLHYWSALELISECDRRYPDIDFKFIGLIRNPVDTSYSMWRRWRAVPETQQYEWLRAYKNLMKLKMRVGERLHVVRYEELVRNPEAIKKLCDFVGIEWVPNMGEDLRTSSLQTWRDDWMFGFGLSQQVTGFAQELGYKKNEIDTRPHPVWPLYRDATRAVHSSLKLTRPLKRRLRSALGSC
ncbi:MAG: sulfotransferase family protein [Gammaproteobacteria bacterium]